jgi:hypothetical protein
MEMFILGRSMMMKKLLLLVLVLGLTSAANAAIEPLLNLTVDGVDVGAEYTMTVGSVIEVGVNSDGIGGTNGKYAAALVINMLGSDTGTGIFLDSMMTIYDGAGEPLEHLTGGMAIPVAPGVRSARATNAVLDDYVLAGIGFDFGFECTGLGDVSITLIDDVFGPVDTLIIHQIPEPITFALLGLGGLFLRRRK